LDQKNLSPDELTDIQERIDALFAESYPFVEFFSLEKAGWDRALELKATTNISAPDCIHVATAIEAGCDVLITLDAFLKKEAEPFINSCSPEQANKTLQKLGFSI
jgi:predicted nucleic acid-binding protein